MKNGNSFSSEKRGNVEYITFNQSAATATSTIASTDAQTAATATSVSQVTQTTFAVDFTTGAIHALQTEAYASSASAQVGPIRTAALG